MRLTRRRSEQSQGAPPHRLWVTGAGRGLGVRENQLVGSITADSRNEERPPPLTPEEAAVRIHELQRVFDQGFLTRDEFEAMKRSIEARALWVRSQP
jgi:hypothetical protein